MAIIGILGHEYDRSAGLLKVRIEDLGHRAPFVNLMHLPRVMRATLGGGGIVFDGRDLHSFDAFYLRDLDMRDPFFHTTYTEEFWVTLRGRYLTFAGAEFENLHFVHNIVRILAERRPVVNPPDVYDHRRFLPYHLNMLMENGFGVAPFTAGWFGEGELGGERPSSSGKTPPSNAVTDENGFAGERLPLSLDENRKLDAYAFPKGRERGLELKRERDGGERFDVVVVGGRALGDPPPDVGDTALAAAWAIGASFALVDIGRSVGGALLVNGVDPSPDFADVEDARGIDVAGPLARHLVSVAEKGLAARVDSGNRDFSKRPAGARG